MSVNEFARRGPTAAEQQAEKAFRPISSVRMPSDYERAQQAFDANRERLKAARLAREADEQSARND